MIPMPADSPVQRIKADRPPQALYPMILCGRGTRPWPRTEWLKAALLLADQAPDGGAKGPLAVSDANGLLAGQTPARRRLRRV